MWIDTDDGDRPYVWDGGEWDKTTTQISGSEITTGTINADRISIGSGTTYATGYDPSTKTDTQRQGTEPATRSDGTALRAGDIWIDTSNGDKPYTYDGADFIAAYTQIDGGSITTGTVNAARLNITGTSTFSNGNTLAENINAGTTTIDGDSITTGSITATQIEAGTITATELAADSVTAGKIDVTDLSAVNTDTGSLTVSGTLTMGASGEITDSGANYSITSGGIDINAGTITLSKDSSGGLFTETTTIDTDGVEVTTGLAANTTVVSGTNGLTANGLKLRLTSGAATSVSLNASNLTGILQWGTNTIWHAGNTGNGLTTASGNLVTDISATSGGGGAVSNGDLLTLTDKNGNTVLVKCEIV